MGWVKGLEPSTYGTTTRRSSQLSYTHHVCHTAKSLSLIHISATINAGGLGMILLSGLRSMNIDKILAGTICCAALALARCV